MYGGANSFPEEVDSVGSWLQAVGMVRHLLSPLVHVDFSKSLNCVNSFCLWWYSVCLQAQYQDAFEEQGVNASNLRSLTDSELKKLVPTPGHRRRIVSDLLTPFAALKLSCVNMSFCIDCICRCLP